MQTNNNSTQNSQTTKTKSGFISIVGKPNVGKSSLLNALIGQKVCIVTPKAQTTRDKVLGILTEDNYQMVFIDTPGIHEPKTELGKYMSKAVSTAAKDSDIVLVVLDASKPITNNALAMLEGFLKKGFSVYVALNKIDLVGFGGVYPLLNKLSPLMTKVDDRTAIKEVVPISCKSKENVQKLKEFLVAELKEDEFYYPVDEVTDRPVRFLIEEVIREKALLYLQEEIPHGIGVMIQTMTEEGNLARITADIVCEKDTHKLIVIGDKGEQLKQIGTAARLDIERLVEKKVYLELFVKVRQNWRNHKSYMDDLGYSKDK